MNNKYDEEKLKQAWNLKIYNLFRPSEIETANQIYQECGMHESGLKKGCVKQVDVHANGVV